MSRFPRWWNTTITLFNRYENPSTQEVSWQRTYINKCFWKINVDAEFLGNHRSNLNSVSKTLSSNFKNIVICRVPKQPNYLSPEKWKALEPTKRASKFTFQNGDIVVKGKVDAIIDEYSSGNRSNEVVSRFKDSGVIRIDTIADNSDDARGLMHYCICEFTDGKI